MNNEYNVVGLYDHNADSYNLVKKAFESGEDVVGIVHATGTGKSFNALQLAYDNKDKKIVYVVPSNGIIEHIKKIIDDNPNLDITKDFPNLEFRTYQSFISLDRDEIENIDCDLLILDEFHHIGAPVWGERINTMIDTHPEMKVFGMTAYTVRDRGTSYERDMANPETDELFSRKIQSRYDLCDAIIDGVLPIPNYKTAYIDLATTEALLEEKVMKQNPNSKLYAECMPLLQDCKKRIHEAKGIPELLQKNIKPNGKYIYFCPPNSEEGTNDIETIKKEALEWFKQFVPEEDIIFYTTTSDMGVEGKKNREAFYDDLTLDGESADGKLRIMFAINQYNEGIHAPNIDGVIMGRGTTSDIVYFEQLGRALSVRGNTAEKFEEYEKYTKEELFEMCKEKDLDITDDMSKEDLIETLIAPVVIDLTNNIDFIRDLENRLKDRIKEIEKSGIGIERLQKIKNAAFRINAENVDIYEELKYVMARLTSTWDDYYELAKTYYEKYGNLLVPGNFKTINGYEKDENGVHLGEWLHRQRRAYNGDSKFKISPEKIKLLEEIGIIWDVTNSNWTKMYNLAKAYYEHHGNLNIPGHFITINGYEKDENGVDLGGWLIHQRYAYNNDKSDIKITPERIKLLEEIGIIWDVTNSNWTKMYNLAKAYYEHHGNLNIPRHFITINGYEKDENGVELGDWLTYQKQCYKGKYSITPERIKLLEEIGIVWIKFDRNENWTKMYNLAKAYYEHHGNLNITKKFTTINGYEEDENGVNLGSWLLRQRQAYNGTPGYSISPERIKLLEEIGIIWDVTNSNWAKMYNLAKAYYEHHGNLNIPRRFTTINGYEKDENGVHLGDWLSIQKKAYKGDKNYTINSEQIKMLEQIGMIWFTKEKNDIDNQKEKITSENLKRKKKEIQNRFYSTLSNFEDSELPNKDDLEDIFMDQLDRKKTL